MKIKPTMTVLYGLSAMAVGIWRHAQTGTSPQAMWFGLSMGSLAIIGAALLSLKNRFPAYIVISLSLFFVGGWFLHRLFSGHPDGASPRVIIILVICAMEVCALLWRSPKTSR
ncbi:MAG: hypothetical protein RRC34_06440 [Lentisphaeria bacterium]|nr:hypothetical protein [Lentisphaeria bacterium]